MKKLIKFVIIVVILAGLGVGAYYVWQWMHPVKAAPAELPPVKVTRSMIRLTVASTGRVVANLDVDIKCKASGEVVKLPFDVSQKVKKGDLLLELNPVDQQRVLTQVEVGLAASKARLEVARQNLAIAERTLVTDRDRSASVLKSAEARATDAAAKADRVKQLIAKQLASQEDYDTALTTLAQVRADLESARIKLAEIETQETALELRRQDVKLAEAQVRSDTISQEVAQDRLADTKVFAPLDGVVSARNVQIGQIIASGVSNVGGGTTVLTLSDLSQVFVLAAVDESDIGKVQIGQPSIITVDAFPGRGFSGQVVRIATRGVNLSNVVTFEVKIEVLGEGKELLKPEMTANVEVVSAEKAAALTVPVEGLTRKEGRYQATVLRADGTTEARLVEIGITDGTRTEIVQGLAEGEVVTLRQGLAESKWNAGPARTGSRPPGMMFGGPPPRSGGGR